MKRRGLVMGISSYVKLRPLSFCERDGEQIYNILRECEYDIPAHHYLTSKVDHEPMRNSIIDFFTNDNISREDTLLFYFSGHGIVGDDGDYFLASSDIDPKKPFINGYSFDDLSKMIHMSKSKNIIIILDCCYSGSLSINKNIYSGIPDDVSKSKEGEDDTETGADIIKGMINSSEEEGVCFLAACQSFEEAYGSSINGHSLFTYYLIKGLWHNIDTVNRWGCVTPGLLSKYIFNEIARLPTYKRPRQQPIKKEISAGDIVLVCYEDLARPRDDELYELIVQGRIAKFNSIYEQKFFVDLGLNFNDRKFNDLNLSGVNFKKVFLSGSIFEDVNLEVSDLSESKLRKAILKRIDLSDSILVRANLTEAHLSDVNLSGAVLTEADLSYSVLEESDLSYANLSGANLYGANLSGADLREANLSGADLTLCDLSFAQYDLRKISAAKSVQGATFVILNPPNNYSALCTQVQAMDNVRFAGIFDNRREVIEGGHRKGIESKLRDHEKSILLHISWLSWRLREQIIQYTGRLLYVIEKYEQAKLIQIPLSRSEIMLISTEINSNHDAIIKYVSGCIPKLHDSSINGLNSPMKADILRLPLN